MGRISGTQQVDDDLTPATKEVRLTDDELRALLRLIDSVSCKPSGAVLRRKLATALNIETHVTTESPR
jgi:hypothetical protein